MTDRKKLFKALWLLEDAFIIGESEVLIYEKKIMEWKGDFLTKEERVKSYNKIKSLK